MAYGQVAPSTRESAAAGNGNASASGGFQRWTFDAERAGVKYFVDIADKFAPGQYFIDR
jgi:hypothetical protein